MGLFADNQLLEWIVNEYPKNSKTRLDMGKSCIRCKKPENISINLLAELAAKVSVQDWIRLYERQVKK